MNHCNQPMRDWSYYERTILEDKIRHLYCPNCGSHFWKDKWYTAEEWFFYINETTFAASGE